MKSIWSIVMCQRPRLRPGVIIDRHCSRADQFQCCKIAKLSGERKQEATPAELEPFPSAPELLLRVRPPARPTQINPIRVLAWQIFVRTRLKLSQAPDCVPARQRVHHPSRGLSARGALGQAMDRTSDRKSRSTASVRHRSPPAGPSGIRGTASDERASSQLNRALFDT